MFSDVTRFKILFGHTVLWRLHIEITKKFVYEWSYQSVSSVAQSCLTLCYPIDGSLPGFPVHHQLLELTQTQSALSLWCHPTISASVIPFSCLQSFPALGSFPVTQFFTSDNKTIGVSASASVLPMNIQDWFPWGWIGCISLLFKGLLRVFSNNTVQKHHIFGAQLSL